MFLNKGPIVTCLPQQQFNFPGDTLFLVDNILHIDPVSTYISQQSQLASELIHLLWSHGCSGTQTFRKSFPRWRSSESRCAAGSGPLTTSHSHPTRSPRPNWLASFCLPPRSHSHTHRCPFLWPLAQYPSSHTHSRGIELPLADMFGER